LFRRHSKSGRGTLETLRPRHTGFCFGVRDALELAQGALVDGTEVVALGQVVHNRSAVAQLEADGLGQASELPPSGPGRVVVTAHGAAPEVFATARERGLEVVDTTCPLVRRVQRHARELRASGWPVVVVGHAGHAEVQGVRGWAGAQVEVVAGEDEAAGLPFAERRGVVCQSTFPLDAFRRVVAALGERTGELRVHDTTCPVVNQRQREAGNGFLDDADVILVVGGRNSANTRALAEACGQRRPTHHIETAEEITPEWFRPGQRVGITSGTSTPDWVVDEVEARCRAL